MVIVGALLLPPAGDGESRPASPSGLFIVVTVAVYY